MFCIIIITVLEDVIRVAPDKRNPPKILFYKGFINIVIMCTYKGANFCLKFFTQKDHPTYSSECYTS